MNIMSWLNTKWVAPSSKVKLVDVLVARIEGDKSSFLRKLRLDIQSHVGGKNPAQCLRLVTHRNGQTVIWMMKEGVPYVLRLIAFVRGVPYTEDGRTYEVDSALTADVVAIVLANMSALVLDHREAIGDVALAEIMLRDATRERFVGVLLRNNVVARAAGAKGKAIVGAALMHGIREKLHHLSASITSNVSDKAGHLLAVLIKSGIVANSAAITAKFAATAGGKMVLAKVGVVMAKSLAPLLAKLLAMPVVHGAIQKIIAVAVVSTIAKLVATKVGMSLGSALTVVLIPIILGLMAKDVCQLPKKLGDSLADAICGELEKSYSKTITDVVTSLLAEFTSDHVVDDLAKALGDDPDIAAELGRLISAGLK